VKHPKSPRRRGLALVPALVCLVLTSLLCLALLRQASLRRSVIAAEGRRLQAEWLAESGLSLAKARLGADPGYRGETWSIPAGPLGGADAAAVTVAVGPPELPFADGRRRVSVRVVADYPARGDRRARQSKELTLDLGTGNPGGPPP